MNLDGILADYEILDAIRTPPLDEAKAERLAMLMRACSDARSFAVIEEETTLRRELYEQAARQKISIRMRHRTTGRLVRLETQEEPE